MILKVAGKLMAWDTPDSLSVSQIAQQAGVNRGTAYHHFQTREQLVDATMEYVSRRLYEEVFANQGLTPERPRDVIARMALFSMEHPEFGPAWMRHMMRDRGNLQNDPFWRGLVESVKQFADSDLAQPGVDAEVHAMTLLTSIFIWPLWVNAREKSPRQRKELAQRYTREALRLAAHGVIRPDAIPGMEAAGASLPDRRAAKAGKAGAGKKRAKT
jgi:AcrR family transcriptional regulator